MMPLSVSTIGSLPYQVGGMRWAGCGAPTATAAPAPRCLAAAAATGGDG